MQIQILPFRQIQEYTNKMAKFKRPIPQRQNDLLRQNLAAPSSFQSPGETSTHFPGSDGLVPLNLPPSKQKGTSEPSS